MKWTWHALKSDWTFKERGFDFDYAIQIFDGRVTLTRVDRNGEWRVKAVGVVHDRHYAVIYTRRIADGERVRRVISARRARDSEKDDYNGR